MILFFADKRQGKFCISFELTLEMCPPAPKKRHFVTVFWSLELGTSSVDKCMEFAKPKNNKKT